MSRGLCGVSYIFGQAAKLLIGLSPSHDVDVQWIHTKRAQLRLAVMICAHILRPSVYFS